MKTVIVVAVVLHLIALIVLIVLATGSRTPEEDYESAIVKTFKSFEHKFAVDRDMI